MKQNGQSAIFFCAVLWSTSGLFTKLIDWHPILIAGIRSLIAAIFLLAVRFLFSRRHTRSQLRHLIAGGISYAVTMITFIVANKMTTSANAILLQYTAPVWAALLGWLLIREKPHIEHWVALAAVMVGLVIFFKDSYRVQLSTLIGDGLALFSGLCFAANSVFMRMQKDGNPSDSMLLSHIICAAFSLPFLFFYPPVLTGTTVSIILFMGIVQIGCASLLFSYGIKRVSAVQSMLTAMIEPILNPLWVLLFVGEKPSQSALIGGAIIVTAVIVSSIAGKRREVHSKLA
jgi:drug/metabolite transporter (DMT)-like permease